MDAPKPYLLPRGIPFVGLSPAFQAGLAGSPVASSLPALAGLCTRCTSSFLSSHGPRLTDHRSTGGAYFVTGTDGAPLAVLKPTDEEPFCPNNPKGLVSEEGGSGAGSGGEESDGGGGSSGYGGGGGGGGGGSDWEGEAAEAERNAAVRLRALGALSRLGGEQPHFMRKGVRPGDGMFREVAAWLLDCAAGSHAGVPQTALVYARHAAMRVSGASRRAYQAHASALAAAHPSAASALAAAAAGVPPSSSGNSAGGSRASSRKSSVADAAGSGGSGGSAPEGGAPAALQLPPLPLAAAQGPATRVASACALHAVVGAALAAAGGGEEGSRAGGAGGATTATALVPFALTAAMASAPTASSPSRSAALEARLRGEQQPCAGAGAAAAASSSSSEAGDASPPAPLGVQQGVADAMVDLLWPPLKRCSLQAFIPHTCSAEDVGSAIWPVEEVHKLAIFDIRVANTDRNDDNILCRAWFTSPGSSSSGSSSGRSSSRSAGGTPTLPRAHLPPLPLDAAASISPASAASAASAAAAAAAAASPAPSASLPELMLTVLAAGSGLTPVPGGFGGSQARSSASSPLLGGMPPPLPQPLSESPPLPTLASTTGSASGSSGQASTATLGIALRAGLRVPSASPPLARLHAAAGSEGSGSSGAGAGSSGITHLSLRPFSEGQQQQQQQQQQPSALLSPPSPLLSGASSSGSGGSASRAGAYIPPHVRRSAQLSAAPNPEQGPNSLLDLTAAGSAEGSNSSSSASAPSSLPPMHRPSSPALGPVGAPAAAAAAAQPAAAVAPSAPVGGALPRAFYSLRDSESSSSGLLSSSTASFASVGGLGGLAAGGAAGSASGAPTPLFKVPSFSGSETFVVSPATPLAFGDAAAKQGEGGGHSASTPASPTALFLLQSEGRGSSSSSSSSAAPLQLPAASTLGALRIMAPLGAAELCRVASYVSAPSLPTSPTVLSPVHGDALAHAVQEQPSALAPLPQLPQLALPLPPPPPASSHTTPLFSAADSASSSGASPATPFHRAASSGLDTSSSSPASIGGLSLLSTSAPVIDPALLSPSGLLLPRADESGEEIDARLLRKATRLELVPIDHGLCLPAASHLADISFSWLHWHQAKEDLSAASLAHIAALSGRGDSVLLWNTFGPSLPSTAHLTLRCSTALLQEGARAGLTLREMGKMMIREGGIGRVVDGEGEEADGASGGAGGGGGSGSSSSVGQSAATAAAAAAAATAAAVGFAISGPSSTASAATGGGSAGTASGGSGGSGGSAGSAGGGGGGSAASKSSAPLSPRELSASTLSPKEQEKRSRKREKRERQLAREKDRQRSRKSSDAGGGGGHSLPSSAGSAAARTFPPSALEQCLRRARTAVKKARKRAVSNVGEGGGGSGGGGGSSGSSGTGSLEAGGADKHKGSRGATATATAAAAAAGSSGASPFGDAAFLNLHDQVEAAFRKGLQVHIAAVLKRRGPLGGGTGRG